MTKGLVEAYTLPPYALHPCATFSPLPCTLSPEPYRTGGRWNISESLRELGDGRRISAAIGEPQVRPLRRRSTAWYEYQKPLACYGVHYINPNPKPYSKARQYQTQTLHSLNPKPYSKAPQYQIPGGRMSGWWVGPSLGVGVCAAGLFVTDLQK